MTGSIDMVKNGRRSRAARRADAGTEPPAPTSISLGDPGVGVTTTARPRHSNGSPGNAWRRTVRDSSAGAPRGGGATHGGARPSERFAGARRGGPGECPRGGRAALGGPRPAVADPPGPVPQPRHEAEAPATGEVEGGDRLGEADRVVQCE